MAWANLPDAAYLDSRNPITKPAQKGSNAKASASKARTRIERNEVISLRMSHAWVERGSRGRQVAAGGIRRVPDYR